MSDFGSSKAGKKGGKTAAKKMSPQARSERARKAAEARWAKASDPVPDSEAVPRALCGGDTPLSVGNIEIPCYVLDDERRVITATGMQEALGFSIGGGLTRLVEFAGHLAVNPSINKDLSDRLNHPIQFIPKSGGLARGYEATLLRDLCDAVLEARKNGKLTARYAPFGEAAEVLLRGFATVGIIAMVDAATGFEKYRKRLALAEVLDKYLSDNLSQWTKTFPDDFYEEFFRLKGWDYDRLKPGQVKPAEVGKFTKNEVYRRLHPGIVEELEKNNPYIVKGRRQHKHHQWLSREVGHPMLEKHLAMVMTVMRLSNDWIHFEANLQKALPRASDTDYFPFVTEDA